jgi:hypothetical protein
VSGLSTACWDLGVASSVSLDFPEFLPDFPDFLPEIRDFRNFCWFKLATVIVLVIISISQSLLKTSKDSASRPIDFFFSQSHHTNLSGFPLATFLSIFTPLLLATYYWLFVRSFGVGLCVDVAIVFVHCSSVESPLVTSP